MLKFLSHDNKISEYIGGGLWIITSILNYSLFAYSELCSLLLGNIVSYPELQGKNYSQTEKTEFCRFVQKNAILAELVSDRKSRNKAGERARFSQQPGNTIPMQWKYCTTGTQLKTDTYSKHAHMRCRLIYLVCIWLHCKL